MGHGSRSAPRQFVPIVQFRRNLLTEHAGFRCLSSAKASSPSLGFASAMHRGNRGGMMQPTTEADAIAIHTPPASEPYSVPHSQRQQRITHSSKRAGKSAE